MFAVWKADIFITKTSRSFHYSIIAQKADVNIFLLSSFSMIIFVIFL